MLHIETRSKKILNAIVKTKQAATFDEEVRHKHMKKALLLFVVALPLAASAQYVQKGDLLAGVNGSVYNRKADHQFDYCLRPEIQWMFARHFSAGIGGEYYNSVNRTYEPALRHNQYTAGVEFRYWPLDGSRRFNPYVFANVATSFGAFSNPGADRFYMSNRIGLGVGAMYAVTPNLFINARCTLYSYGLEKPHTVGFLSMMETGLGVTWRVGNISKNRTPQQ